MNLQYVTQKRGVERALNVKRSLIINCTFNILANDVLLSSTYNTISNSMQVLLILLVLSVLLSCVASVASVVTETSSGSSNQPFKSFRKPNTGNLHPEDNQVTKEKKRKEVPDLNEFPPKSDTEEDFKREKSKKLVVANGSIGKANEEAVKQKPKTKYQKECERLARLPADRREEVRIKAENKSRRYRERMKSETGVTSRKILHIRQLQALRKTGKTTKKQNLELAQILEHRRRVRREWRSRVRLNSRTDSKS